MTDPQGIRRSVRVNAETLFEAAALAVYAFRKDGFRDFVSNVFEVEIREPVVKHNVSVGQLKKWLNGTVSDPREAREARQVEGVGRLMSVQLFTDGIEPPDLDAPILRFMERWKFEDLLKGRMYFRRADLFEDESEGLPLDDYWQTLNLNPYDLNDIQKRNQHLGFDAQIRQSYFIACWYLGLNEPVRMWRSYATGNGVAVCSTYRRLKTALDALAAEDKAHLGLVRYGNAHLVPGRVNLMINVSTKQLKYADEREVRAMLWLVDPHETGNRHIDIDNRFHPRPIYPTGQPEGVHRPVDIQTLVTKLIVSPFAEAEAQRDTEALIRSAGYAFPVERSTLTEGAGLLPTEAELRRYLEGQSA